MRFSSLHVWLNCYMVANFAASLNCNITALLALTMPPEFAASPPATFWPADRASQKPNFIGPAAAADSKKESPGKIPGPFM